MILICLQKPVTVSKIPLFIEKNYRLLKIYQKEVSFTVLRNLLFFLVDKLERTNCHVFSLYFKVSKWFIDLGPSCSNYP